MTQFLNYMRKKIAKPGGLLSGPITREEVEEAGSLEAVYAERAKIDPFAQRVIDRLMKPFPAYTPERAATPKKKKYSLPFGMKDPRDIRMLREILGD